MKLTRLLLSFATCCLSLKSGYGKSTTQTTTNEKLLEHAALQLSRLSAFRRTREPQREVIKVQPQDNEYQSISVEAQKTEDILEAQKRIDELRASASEFLQDPRYRAMMQERIKRSFISGIANKFVGGIVGAASGASRGIVGLSSSNTPSEYGSYGHSYQNKFDIGDFAKAIINTLIQAIKAIGGGAIAGGGALVKGGGYLVSAKGQILSSAGNAITSLGKSLASSAIIASPKPVYGHPGYSYNHQSPQPPNDLTYDGPPPSSDAYVGPEDAYNADHSSYTAPSNDDGVDNQAGILIVKETKPGQEEHDNPPTSSVHESNPSLSALQENFGGPSKGLSGTVTKIVGILNSGQPTVNDHSNHEEHTDYYPDQDHQQPPSSHQSLASGFQSDSQLNQNKETDHNTNHQSYQSNKQMYDSYGTKLQPYSPQSSNDYTESHQASANHQPLSYQDIQETLNTYLDVPKLQEPTTFKDLSSFADPHHHGNQHHSEPLKIPILESHQNSLDHSNDNQVGSLNYYGLPNYGDQSMHSPIGFPTDGSYQSILPDYNNYQLQNVMGFDRYIQHPAPIMGGPSVLGVWGRISRRTSGLSKKAAVMRKGQKLQRSGYSLMNTKLTRI